MDIEKNFASNLKKIRIMQGITQTELARLLDIKPQSISKYESGENFPTGEKLAKILEVLNVTPNEILAKEFKPLDRIEQIILDFHKEEESFTTEIERTRYSGLYTESEFKKIEIDSYNEYIENYIHYEKRRPEDLKSIVELISYMKLKKIRKRYDDYLNYEELGETLDGDKNVNPFSNTEVTSFNIGEDGEITNKNVEYPDDFN